MFPTFFILDCTPTLDLHRNNARNTEYNVLAIMDHKTICDIYRLDRQKVTLVLMIKYETDDVPVLQSHLCIFLANLCPLFGNAECHKSGKDIVDCFSVEQLEISVEI